MPYSGPKDPKLPNEVAKLPYGLRRLWIAVFNESYDPADEGVAFRNAWAAVRRAQGEKERTGMFDKDAIKAWLRGTKAKRTDGGAEYDASAYLVVPDPDKPSTWKLRVEESPGKVTVPQLGKAAAALGPGFRGQIVELEDGERTAAAKKLIGLYRNNGVEDDDVPEYLWEMAGMEKSTAEDAEDAEKARSLEQWQNAVQRAWYEKYPGPATPDGQLAIGYPYPYEIYQVQDDSVVVYDGGGQYSRVPYTATVASAAGGNKVVTDVVFAEPGEWVPVVPVYSEFKAYDQPDGRTRWLLVSSGGFEDRDGEVVSTAFLKAAVEAADETGQRGPLLVYHVPGSDIGACDTQAVIGEPGFLLESGLFADSDRGRRAAAYYKSHVKETGASIKFLYVHRSEDGVYAPPGAIIERSLLPRDRAAFPWAALTIAEVQKEMAQIDEAKRRALVDVLGEDETVQILNQLDANAESLKELGVRFKAKEDATATAEADPKPVAANVPAEAVEAAEDAALEADDEPAQADEEGEAEKSAEPTEWVLTPEAITSMAKETASIVEAAFAEKMAKLTTLSDELATVRAAVEKLSRDVSSIQRSEDERIAEKVRHLPRATVRAAQAPELYRATKAKEAEETPENGQADGTLLQRGLKALYG